MKSVRLFTWLLAVILATGLSSRGQVLLNQTFDDPEVASQRFTTVGPVQFTGYDVQLPPNSAIFLNTANAIADDGSSPIRYSIVQSFAPGNIVYPNQHDARFYVRVPGGSVTDGYQILTSLNSLGPYIAVLRGDFTFLGGSLFAPPALNTLGPYELAVTVWNTADAVNIDVMVGGVHALTARDTFSNRLTSGESVGFGYYGTHSAFIDNLSVTVVPEPASGALLLFGLLVPTVFRMRQWRLRLKRL